MSVAATIGLAAGVLQALGYLVYLAQMLRGETRPNGMTWLMSTSGSVVFLVVASRLGVPVSLLLLPAVCALCSAGIAAHFMREVWLRPERRDWPALAFYTVILAGYAGPAGATFDGRFVAAAGVAIIIARWPLLRTTLLDPRHERPLAWLVWSAAYGLLTLAAMLEGMSWPFLVYPVVSLAINLLISLLAFDPDDSSRHSGAQADGSEPSTAQVR